jgi:hypothetical protein
MEENNERQEKGQSLVIIAFAVIVLLIFAVIAVDLAYGYVHRRGDQNAADAASLAGARELARIRNENGGEIGGGVRERPIQEAMNAFAEENGIEDTDGNLGNSVNSNVVGYYLDAEGNRLQSASGQDIAIGQRRFVDPDAMGIEAIVHSVAPSFFGGVVGLNGLPIQADAAVVFAGNLCEAGCIAPIAVLTMTFEYAPACYNIWDGTRQQEVGGDCPDYGACDGGTCRKNDTVLCRTDEDCTGVCPLGGVCSLPRDGSQACTSNGDCADYGPCVGTSSKTCQGDPSIACNNDADCRGTCKERIGWYCSATGTPCLGDEDCGEDDFCEDSTGGGGTSGLGWLNWTLNRDGRSCQDAGEANDCSTACLVYNMQRETCLSGAVEVDEWVAGTSGVKNSSNARTMLQCYAGLPPGANSPMCTRPGDSITISVYDVAHGNGCNQTGAENSGKLEYHVVGFAEFRVHGYMLSQGSGNAYCEPGYDCDNCEDWGQGGNRITGEFIRWVDGIPGDCDTNSTITPFRMVK